MRPRSQNNPLARARRGNRRLAFAGLLLVLCGLLIVAIGATVIPFFFPFALVVGGGVMLIGWRLRRRLGPRLGIAAAGASLLAGLGAALAGGLGLVLGALLAVAGAITLVIVFVDAGRFLEVRD